MYDTSKPIIFLVCDLKYLKYLNCFLYFLDKNVSFKQVYIHFINVDQSSINQVINQFSFVGDYSSEETHLNTKNTKTALPPFPALRHSNKMFVNSSKSGTGKLYSEKEAYCANIRFKIIPKILKKYSSDLIYIDVDNVINRDITSLYEKISQADLLVVPCLDEDPRISTTLFCIKNIKKMQDIFFSIWLHIRGNVKEWGIDHIAVNNIINQNDIIIKQLPNTYYDEQYNSKSYVWINHLTMYGMSDKYQRIIDEIHLHTDTVL
jgi:hypothetical protein